MTRKLGCILYLSVIACWALSGSSIAAEKLAAVEKARSADSPAAPLILDERPAGEDEWGCRPADGSALATTPPGFCWRPQKEIVAYLSIFEEGWTDFRRAC